MTRADYEFARQVDAMGVQGKTQEEIAEAFGLSKNQVRHRLFKAGLFWGVEMRVRAGLTRELLEELIERGVVPVENDQPAEAVA
jgi:hypothetical protein